MRMRPIQLYLMAHWSPKTLDLESKIPIKFPLLEHILWWENPLNLLKGCPFHCDPQWVHVSTDASNLGWGAHCLGRHVSGKWQDVDRENGAKAIHLALKSLSGLLQDKNVMVHSDNSTVVAYINREGGTRSPTLCFLTWEILLWCVEHNVALRCCHIPGRSNHIAVSVDAMAFSWTGMFLYAFPPFSLIPSVIQKWGVSKGCTLILLAPVWTQSPWYPDLLQVKKAGPLILRKRIDLLRQPHNRKVFPGVQQLELAAWLL